MLKLVTIKSIKTFIKNQRFIILLVLRRNVNRALSNYAKAKNDKYNKNRIYEKS